MSAMAGDASERSGERDVQLDSGPLWHYLVVQWVLDVWVGYAPDTRVTRRPP